MSSAECGAAVGMFALLSPLRMGVIDVYESAAWVHSLAPRRPPSSVMHRHRVQPTNGCYKGGKALAATLTRISLEC